MMIILEDMTIIIDLILKALNKMKLWVILLVIIIYTLILCNLILQANINYLNYKLKLAKIKEKENSEYLLDICMDIYDNHCKNKKVNK